MRRFDPDMGFEIGQDAADQFLGSSERMAAHHRRSQELKNEGRLSRLDFRATVGRERIEELRALLRRTTDDGNVAGRIFRFCLAAVLVVGSLCLIEFALAPFGLGPQVWLIAAGASITCVIATHSALQRFGRPTVLGVVGLLAFCTALIGLLQPADIRVELMLMQVKSTLQTNGPSTEDGVRFYQTAAPHLRLFWLCLTTAMEIVIGLLIFDAMRSAKFAVERAHARRELAALYREREEMIEECVELRNGPAIEEAEFLRDMYYGALAATVRSGVRRFGTFGGATFVFLLIGHVLQAQPHRVVALDATRSTAVAVSADGVSEFEKNVEAGTAILRRLPPGSRFSVIGITSKSFSNPLVLASGQIPTGPGPLAFVNKIDTARAQCANQFVQAAKRITVNAQTTDVIGALFLVSEILKHVRGRRELIVLSDMRQSVPPINLETPKAIPIAALLRFVEGRQLIPDLRNVDVWVLGVDADGKDITYMRTLREFWTAYFAKSGARLMSFSMLREIPDFTLKP